MRTTIDLPDDLHEAANALARDTSRSLSDTIAELVRRGLEETTRSTITINTRSGLPQVRMSRVITAKDVRRWEEEDDE